MASREDSPVPIDPEEETLDTPLDPPAAAPDRIGRYHIKRVIASGGMGTVYEATQENPRRVVALKVMRSGLTSRSALRRFEYESQILARLRHPGIAQVYEAGTHDEGDTSLPFFAMEYVAGARPITDHADVNRLELRRRLALFAQVCDAVHHGHQKGIIHRDLKPDNILVDAKGRVRIIDFGVARATDSDMAVTTLQTDVGQLVGTIQYMSPEQVAAEPHDLDTRSDVYALGVVLYQLLSGQLPYDVRGKSIYEASRQVREETPAPPSRIDRVLGGDLETIVMKALEKDRERRYQSADEFGRDVERYLEGRPILARPPSLAYQVRLFVRHNRLVVAAMLLLGLALAAGAVGITVGMLQARQGRDDALAAQARADVEAERARAVSDFLRRTLASANPILPRESSRLAALGESSGAYAGAIGREVTAVDLLRQATERLDGAFLDDPEIEGELRRTLGTTFLGLGQFEESEAQLERALALAGQDGASPVETARLRRLIAEALERQGRVDEADAVLARTIADLTEHLGPAHAETLDAAAFHADATMRRGDVAGGVARHRETVDIARRTLGPDDPLTLAQMVRFCEALWIATELDEAIDIGRDAVAGLERTAGHDALETAGALYALSGALRSANRLDEARELADRSLRDTERALGVEHPTSLVRRAHLANIVFLLGDFERAETLHRDVLEAQRRLMAPTSFELLWVANDLACVLVARDHHLEEAEALAREAVAGFEATFGPDTQLALNARDTVAMIMNAQSRPEEAAEHYRAILDAARRRRLQDSVHINARVGLAHSHVLLERYEEAKAELDRAADLVARDPDQMRVWFIADGYVRLYEAWGKPDEAEPWRGP